MAKKPSFLEMIKQFSLDQEIKLTPKRERETRMLEKRLLTEGLTEREILEAVHKIFDYKIRKSTIEEALDFEYWVK